MSTISPRIDMARTSYTPATYTPAANDSGRSTLGSYHTQLPPEATNNYLGRIIGGIVLAAMLLGGGFYLYSLSAPPPKVTASHLPYTPPPPNATTPAQPAPQQ